MIRLLHTADLHIGMKYRSAGFPDEVREKLVAARPEALKKMIQIAQGRDCDLVTIGGDLFDSPRVSKKEINDLVAILEESIVPVAILPGNHDYFQSEPGTLWQDVNAQLEGTKHWVMTENRPYPVEEIGLTLFPGVCTSRHSEANAIGWIREAASSMDGSHLRIGIAHGSLEGLSPDFDGRYFPMTHAELEESGMHAWLLGHTHLRYPDVMSGSGEGIFFPSTPEPDGFGCDHDGHSLILELDETGKTHHEFVRTGTYHFRNLRRSLSCEEDVKGLFELFETFDVSHDLVRLTLTGRVPRDVYDRKAELIERLRKQVLHLDEQFDGLLCQIQKEDIDRDFTEGSFPHLLLSALSEDEEDSQALQIAYQLVTAAQL